MSRKKTTHCVADEADEIKVMALYDPLHETGSDDEETNGKTQNEEPIWKEYKDNQGRVYYHNRYQ